jgi:LPS sulfotransferase NodH
LRPNVSYFICTTPRSGSSLLCGALGSTQIAGNPDEYFGKEERSVWDKQWGPSASYEEHLNRVFREATTPNGVCGVKMFIADGYKDDYLYDLARKAGDLPRYRMRGLSAPEVMGELFPNLHYIWLTRRDKVRQAVSFCKARQTKVWVAYTRRENTPAAPAVYDFETVHRTLQELVMHEAEWQEYFTAAGVRPLTVVYEDFVCEYEETVGRVLRHLGVAPPAGMRLSKPYIRKQADEESEQWVRRYREELSRRLP